MFSSDQVKERVGVYAADHIQQGMTVGLGTGTTVYWLIRELGKRVARGLQFKAIPTSLQTQELAIAQNITLADLTTLSRPEITLDGADEIAPDLSLIKGGGGALLQEKIVAAASRQLIIIADESKLVKNLGNFPLPIEVIPFGWQLTRQHILELDCKEVVLRQKNGNAVVTDHGHFILDCHFEKIFGPEQLNQSLHTIPGVVETGLFIKMADAAIIGYADGKIMEHHPPHTIPSSL